ncbi:hypothetical protein GDI3900 (plasmid) [Gluconacetobacter diazotrophicus PA1 5]|uniref:Uncharacterized protein n=1 Tax=Gluconacetobacter diazotrophicus (strain ATCC 49037 / DSM 5601 / CCUG 37298 / CIP 103539 / LMG 7603 / PAl5) TaxID=272568 RepID=A9HT64_GLUDA|nr:hypothetical protein GDI3900 [Gluconacetobacter diazotrophicus PA1 5]
MCLTTWTHEEERKPSCPKRSHTRRKRKNQFPAAHMPRGRCSCVNCRKSSGY